MRHKLTTIRPSLNVVKPGFRMNATAPFWINSRGERVSGVYPGDVVANEYDGFVQHVDEELGVAYAVKAIRLTDDEYQRLHAALEPAGLSLEPLDVDHDSDTGTYIIVGPGQHGAPFSPLLEAVKSFTVHQPQHEEIYERCVS